MRNRIIATALLVGCALAGTFVASNAVRASDHDDGTNGTKNKALGLTDLYVFRDKDQNASGSADDLVFIMNSNPRSEGGKQYYYATDTRYEFNIGRVASNGATGTGVAEMKMRFEFGAPDEASKQQAMRVTFLDDRKASEPMTSTQTTDGKLILTTPMGQQPIVNTVSLGGQNLSVFSGLREDPFFFDVDQFLKVRSSAAARAGGDQQAQVTFRKPGVDFTAGLNVLSIAVRVPKALLQASVPGTNTFDVWETISVKK